MIYMSLLTLDMSSRQSRAEVANPYEMHRTLSHAFRGESQDSVRCLFRVEEGDGVRSVSVLVQSQLQPDWKPIEARNRYLDRPVATKPIDLKLRNDDHLSFRLRANPTVCRGGRRLPVWCPRPCDETPESRMVRLEENDKAYTEWMTRKADEAGAKLLRVAARPEGKVTFKTASGQPTTLDSVLFEGILIVRDADKLITAIENGVGRGKGFGFGLLSLARPR